MDAGSARVCRAALGLTPHHGVIRAFHRKGAEGAAMALNWPLQS